jgi:hypothetical protein
MIRANPQAEAVSRRARPYQNVSRETFWYDLGQKPYKAQDSGHSLQFVSSIDLSAQLREGGGGVSLAQPVAGRHPLCKVR